MSKHHREISWELATKSIVLLKNKNDVLPLHKNQKIAIIGPFAKSQDILGPWSWLGSREEAIRYMTGFPKKSNTISFCMQRAVELKQEQLKG